MLATAKDRVAEDGTDIKAANSKWLDDSKAAVPTAKQSQGGYGGTAEGRTNEVTAVLPLCPVLLKKKAAYFF